MWDALPRPDVDAAPWLIDATESNYGFDVDETELRKLGERLREYDEPLADRTTTRSEEEALGSHGSPEGRMHT